MRVRTSRRCILGCLSSAYALSSFKRGACVSYVMKGYLVDWDAQKAIWDGIFSDQVLNVSSRVTYHPSLKSSPTQVDTAETSLLITEPYFNLPNIQQVYDQFVFEEYEFQSYLCSTRALSSSLAVALIYMLLYSRSSCSTRRIIRKSGATTTRMHACGGCWLQLHPYSPNYGGCCSLVGCEKVCGL